MKPLDQLARISRWRLDEKRQKLLDLERLAERLRADLRRLEEGLAAERKLAAEDELARRAFPAFLEAELDRKARLQKSIADVDGEIEQAREELSDTFRESKKFELAKANQDERLRRHRDHAEQGALDELGTQLHRRNKSDGDIDSGAETS